MFFSSSTHFNNRREAGQKLASNLVLALPRGGLPVAKEVASELHAPLDLVTVRKVGCPGYDEFAVGALTEESVWLNEETLQQLGYTQHTPAVVSTIEKEKKEARRREHVYRASIPESLSDRMKKLNPKAVILVDDGVATGSTMKVSMCHVAKILNEHWKGKAETGKTRLIVAIPVAPKHSLTDLKRTLTERHIDTEHIECDVVCVEPIPDHQYQAVGQFYLDFSQTTDDEVVRTMREMYHEN